MAGSCWCPHCWQASILPFQIFEPRWLNARITALFTGEISGKHRFLSTIVVNLTNTVTGSLFIAGALLVGFSKEKK